MDMTGYLAFLLLALAVTVLSYALDRLYAGILPARFLYMTIRAPGIVLHELAHVAGCLVTGAEIRRVVLLSKEGGCVTYASPKIPVLGTVIISTAPLLLLPLVLSLLTWTFSSFFGCSLAVVIPEPWAGDAATRLIATVTGIFSANLAGGFNGWFLLYLFLCISIILSLAPSRQDFTNAAAGIAFMALCGLAVTASGYAPAVSLLGDLLRMTAYPFMLGLAFELVAAAAALPLLIAYGIRQW